MHMLHRLSRFGFQKFYSISGVAQQKFNHTDALTSANDIINYIFMYTDIRLLYSFQNFSHIDNEDLSYR